MKKFSLLIIVGLLGFSKLSAQSAFATYDRDYYHLLDRYLILYGQHPPHTAFKPYRRDAIGAFLDSVRQEPQHWNRADQFNLLYLENDNWEFLSQPSQDSRKPFKGLYRKPADFFHYRDSVFDVHINPVIYWRLGNGSAGKKLQFRNTRGIELRGSIDRKIGFYTFLTTTETSLPHWADVYAKNNGAVPGEGFWKTYGDAGYSYFSAIGYVTFQVTPHIEAQLGQDRNFVGEGYRSMILSDFSNPYMFLKLNTKIWKFNLTNLWGQMNADVLYNRGRPTDGRYPQKWFSHHRLGINLGKTLNIGLFESVMASQLDWNYINPLIFYRWVEHQLGTPDKVMLGGDFKWNFYSSMQLYGQLALDEFVFKEFFELDRKNSSRNKHGFQLGYKYINLFKLPNLDLHLEYNQARPYTYQEKFDHQSFSNYRTPLTHPRGANFKEMLAILRYQPLPRLYLNATGVYQFFGTDPNENTNFGGDILKNRTTQSTSLFGNIIGQGIENKVLMMDLNANYALKHHLFLDVGHTYRKHTLSTDAPSIEHFSQVSIRMNIGRQEFNY
jgi:hypothetical protein